MALGNVSTSFASMRTCEIMLPGNQLPPVYGPRPHRAWYLPPMRARRAPRHHENARKGAVNNHKKRNTIFAKNERTHKKRSPNDCDCCRSRVPSPSRAPVAVSLPAIPVRSVTSPILSACEPVEPLCVPRVSSIRTLRVRASFRQCLSPACQSVGRSACSPRPHAPRTSRRAH